MNENSDTNTPLLSLLNVCLAHQPDYDAGMEEVTFSLFPGDLALMLAGSGVERHPLPDVVSGLVAPDDGDVQVFGTSWSIMSPDEQAAMRAKIGRVFADHAWINNLDVDENVTLAARYHDLMPREEITKTAGELARLAGLDALPQTRPAVTDREVLGRAQWVRAALTSPPILVLDWPGFHLAHGWRKDLLPMVDRARARGAAVLWLCESEQEWNDETLKPTLKLRAERKKLCVERKS